MSWWSRTYSRPLKDPILLSYSLEELIYEYYDRVERDAAAIELRKAEDDKIEEAKDHAAANWADEEEAREAEELKKKQEQQKDPRQDPSNIEWMNKVIEEEKNKIGQDFGGNLTIDFNEK